ncbi:MAG TPA: tRNA (adenosine(37)-N6)-threonylcarbamoyltransferase complex dimerization subunit type 1 TsaB [Longimicrobiaceae bacterium]|nr:tRNA (adenosine(37)-N6)-threonylcarbamoyltransferase complex dimerization subunit type 1 TsaB [Longimicrobiaceae bacterium]
MSAAPRGPILALDSSTNVGSVAVGDASGLFAETVRNVAAGHSSGLLPAAEEAMRAAGLSPRELTAVVVGAGPGSFTGLRIAAATAKGVVQALGIPLFAYSGLLAAACSGWGADRPVCALFDARRRDVYAACYSVVGRRSSVIGRERTDADPTGTDVPGGAVEGAVEVLLPPTALSVDEVIERWRGDEPPLFAGEGAVLHREELERELGARVMPPHLGLPRASALLWLATRAPELGAVADAATWEPEYVRASGAERIAAERRSGGGA